MELSPKMQRQFSFSSVFRMIEKGVCIFAISALVLIATAEVLAKLFGSGVPASSKLLLHLLLLL